MRFAPFALLAATATTVSALPLPDYCYAFGAGVRTDTRECATRLRWFTDPCMAADSTKTYEDCENDALGDLVWTFDYPGDYCCTLYDDRNLGQPG